MASKSKSKGTSFERQIVQIAQESGFDLTKRAWGSNGRAMGWPEEVDVLIQQEGGQEYPIQAKIRKQLPAYLQIPKGTEAVICRQDRGPTMVLIDIYDYLEYCSLRDSTREKEE